MEPVCSVAFPLLLVYVAGWPFSSSRLSSSTSSSRGRHCQLVHTPQCTEIKRSACGRSWSSFSSSFPVGQPVPAAAAALLARRRNGVLSSSSSIAGLASVSSSVEYCGAVGIVGHPSDALQSDEGPAAAAAKISAQAERRGGARHATSQESNPSPSPACTALQCMQQQAGGCSSMESSEQAESSSSAPPVSCRSPTCPPWLQAAIADIEQRVRALAVDEAPPPEHSFAERAENYYHKRPQLLSLLTDLHRRYLSLADRYSQSLSTLHHHKQHAADSLPAPHHAAVSDSDCGSSDVDDRCSDADSSLSYQLPSGPVVSTTAEAELVVAELVIAWVERDVLADEAARRAAESARRIELQGSLVEVLESERLVLLGENARLGFRLSSAEAEAAAAVAALGYARRRAAEMARLVVKLREDHRVCMLGRKAEALQAQVYALELRNRECFEAMAAWEAERRVVGAEIQRLRAENRRLADEAAAKVAAAARGKRKGSSGSGGWWARVRMAAEWTPCAPAATVAVRKVGGQQVKGKEDDGEYYYGGGCFCV